MFIDRDQECTSRRGYIFLNHKNQITFVMNMKALFLQLSIIYMHLSCIDCSSTVLLDKSPGDSAMRGGSHDSIVKSACCSCRGPGFGS